MRPKLHLSAKEKTQRLINNKMRSRTANRVKRMNIDNRCFICGKPGEIVYNLNNRNKIAFLCIECKKKKISDEEIAKHTVDIEEIMYNNLMTNMRHKSTKRLHKSDIIKIVEDYLEGDYHSIGSYCEDIKISRFQFNKVIDMYDELFSDKNVKELIKRKRVRKL